MAPSPRASGLGALLTGAPDAAGCPFTAGLPPDSGEEFFCCSRCRRRSSQMLVFDVGGSVASVGLSELVLAEAFAGAAGVLAAVEVLAEAGSALAAEPVAGSTGASEGANFAWEDGPSVALDGSSAGGDGRPAAGAARSAEADSSRLWPFPAPGVLTDAVLAEAAAFSAAAAR